MSKILVVASTFPSSNQDPIPAFVKDQIININQQFPDYEFSVLAPHDAFSDTKNFSKHDHYDEYRFHYFWPHKAEKLTGRGIMPALRQNKLNYFLIPLLFLAEFFHLLKLTRKLKPDFIYAHWFTPQGITAAWVSRVTKTPFILTSHAADVDVWNKIPWLGPKIVRQNLKRATAITAVSTRSMNKIKQFYAESDWQKIAPKTKIIPMGVDFQTRVKVNLSNLKQKYNLENKTVLFFMGRLAEKKGVKYLLEAFSNLPDRKKYQLVIAGDGPLANELKNLAQKLQINDRTTFTGYLSGQQKTDFLNLADMMILPSIITNSGDAEGMPVVFMEGLAHGKICIATHESGADEIIKNNQSGFLIDQKNSEQITQAIQVIEKLSPEQKNKIKARAKAEAAQFDWKIIAQKHVEFFEAKLKKATK